MGPQGLILAALLLLAAPAAAQPLPDSALLTAEPPERIAALVRQMGRPAELETDEAGEPSIATGFGGVRGRIWFYDCDDAGKNCLGIQLQIGLVSERKLTPADVNRFNAERRFGKLWLDESGDAILAQDLSLAPPGISVAAFRDTFALFDAQAEALRLLLEELARAEAAAVRR